MITEQTTCSHDFIYTVTTLFTQLRLYLLSTVGAEYCRVEYHRCLNDSVAEKGEKALLACLVGRREAVTKYEVKPLDECDDQKRQAEGRGITNALTVGEGVREAGRGAAHQSHIVTPAK